MAVTLNHERTRTPIYSPIYLMCELTVWPEATDKLGVIACSLLTTYDVYVHTYITCGCRPQRQLVMLML